MTAYYPSQSGYGQVQQPVMYGSSYVPTAYGQPAGGVVGVPQMTQMMPTMGAVGAPVMVQPSVGGYAGGYAAGYGGYGHGYNPHNLTWGQRIRLFFGLAPTPAFKYRSDRNSWGFMGYSRRQRFIDPRTGGEVDRDGRPVIRV